MGTPFALTKVSSSEEWPSAAWWGMISGGRKGPGQCSFEIAPKRDAFLRTSDETVLDLLERAERAGPCALGVEIAKPSSISPIWPDTRDPMAFGD
jgi:hypothetical protein